jgi:hypothetical protein
MGTRGVRKVQMGGAGMARLGTGMTAAMVKAISEGAGAQADRMDSVK